MRWKTALLLTIVLLSGLLPTESHAIAVMFSDRTAWQTAADLAGLQREAVDLSGIPDGIVFEIPLPFAETLLLTPTGDFKTGDSILHTTTSTTNTFDPAPFTGAFGFDMGPVGVDLPVFMSLTLDDGATLGQVVSPNTVAFFGWVGGSITSMTFGCTTGECGDFIYRAMEKAEAVSQIPEPGSLALIGSVLVAASAWAVVRKRHWRQRS